MTTTFSDAAHERVALIEIVPEADSYIELALLERVTVGDEQVEETVALLLLPPPPQPNNDMVKLVINKKYL